jgi:hypothetical protein
MPTTFAPVTGQLGFDPLVTPAWVTLSIGVSKNVILKDGAGLSVALRNPGDKAFLTVAEAKATALGRVFTLTAMNTAKTVFIDATNSTGRPVVSLEVAVKKPVKLNTLVHLVFDKAGRRRPQGMSGVEQTVQLANKIMQPQTNLTIDHRLTAGMHLPFEMPRGVPADFPKFHAPHAFDRPAGRMMECISSTPLGPEGCMPETDINVLRVGLERAKPPVVLDAKTLKQSFEALRATQMLTNMVNRLDPLFEYHILFIADFDRSQGGLATTTGAFTPPADNGVEINCCLMPPGAGFQSLAHELCHFLLRTVHVGPGRHSTGENQLMRASPGQLDVNISKDQANAINPSP